MKRISSLAIIPFLVALGACSSTNKGGSPNQASNNDAGTTDDGGTNNDGATGDDSSGDDGGMTATEFDATLSAYQVVPIVASTANGTAKFTLQPDGVTLNYDITQNVSNATAVNLHIGAPGENGTVTHQLTPVSGHMTGSVTLTSDEQTAITADQLYIDVASQGSPGGEVRGQIIPPNAEIFVAIPTGAQEVPAVKSQYSAHASFVLNWDPTSSTGSLVYHVVTTAVPTDVNLHRAIGAMNGPVAYPLTPIGQTVDGNQALTGNSDHDDLEAGRFYVNIVTASNGAGELRGQLIKPGQTLFTGVLAGSAEVPPVTSQATGGAQFVLSADQTNLAYEAVVSGVIPTGAELDKAAKGQNGPVLYQLTLNQAGALGTTGVNSGDVALMNSSGIAVNIRTASFATGELRAQLTKQ